MNEFFRGFIKIHILHHAEKGPVFGLEMARELQRHGYEQVSPGTLYPALHALEEAGLLESRRQLDQGRWRRHYTITRKGRATLGAVRRQLVELVREVVAEAVAGPGSTDS